MLQTSLPLTSHLKEALRAAWLTRHGKLLAFSPSESPGPLETVTHLRGQTKPDANRPKHLHKDYDTLTAEEVFFSSGYSWNPKLSQVCSWLSRDTLPLPKQNIFLLKPQSPMDYIYAVFHLSFLLPYSLSLFQLGLSHPELRAAECPAAGLGTGFRRAAWTPHCPNPPGIWAAPLFNPDLNQAGWDKPGSPCPAAGGWIYYASPLRRFWHLSFVSFAFLYMPKPPNFISAIRLEMLRWALLVLIKEIGLKLIPWCRRATGPGWRANAHSCLLISPFLLRFCLQCLWKQMISFSF